MGKIADQTYLQKRILNRSKGPAVWALRAQVRGGQSDWRGIDLSKDFIRSVISPGRLNLTMAPLPFRQTDKLEYSRAMRAVLESEPNLHIREVHATCQTNVLDVNPSKLAMDGILCGVMATAQQSPSFPAGHGGRCGHRPQR